MRQLFKLLVMANKITSNRDINTIMQLALDLRAPSALQSIVDDQSSCTPSAPTISRYQITLDVAYALWWRDRWLQSLSRSTLVYMMADSSPQFQRDWFIVECSILEDAQDTM